MCGFEKSQTEWQARRLEWKWFWGVSFEDSDSERSEAEDSEEECENPGQEDGGI